MSKYKRGSGIPDPVDIYVGKRLRERRILSGISQERLAEAVDLTFQQIQKYERGRNRISASKLYRLGQYFDIDTNYFFDGFPNKNRREPAPPPVPVHWCNLYHKMTPKHREVAKSLIKTLISNS